MTTLIKRKAIVKRKRENSHDLNSDDIFELFTNVMDGEKTLLGAKKFGKALGEMSQKWGLKKLKKNLKESLLDKMNLFQLLCESPLHNKILFLRELVPYVDVNYAPPETKLPILSALSWDEEEEMTDFEEEFYFSPLFNVDINGKADKYSTTLLQLAITRHRNELVKNLIEHGADVNGDNSFINCITAACQGGNRFALQMLLDKKAIVKPGDLRFFGQERDVFGCIQVLVNAWIDIKKNVAFLGRYQDNANFFLEVKKVVKDQKRIRNWPLIKTMFCGLNDQKSPLSLLPSEIFRHLIEFVNS